MSADYVCEILWA